MTVREAQLLIAALNEVGITADPKDNGGVRLEFDENPDPRLVWKACQLTGLPQFTAMTFDDWAAWVVDSTPDKPGVQAWLTLNGVRS